jgi:hypothetical protein
MTLTLRGHNVEDYAVLRDMNTTDVAVLDDDDQACLDELGEYLISTDAWRRFAIWLLHKHFEPAAGEIFVERTVVARRGTETTLVKRCCTQGLNVASMRFDPDVSSDVGVIAMEFADPADFGSTRSVSSGDEEVLAGIAERLRTHGKTLRFGVRLIRNPLGLMENEVLVETCDVKNRILRCTVAERDVQAANSIETNWEWETSFSKFGLTAKRFCSSVCQFDDDWGAHLMWGHTWYPD